MSTSHSYCCRITWQHRLRAMSVFFHLWRLLARSPLSYSFCSFL
uniref:Transcription initiation factor TFIID subunit 14b-like n=1 Tax=Rhizophora mucronata TaxID=61149 RepID=A0A2P2KQR7_RHIMU